MCEKYGVNILYDTTLIGVRRTDAKIEAVQISGVGKNFELEADYFIDATGDANLFAFANEEFVLGRESDGKTQPMTLCFRILSQVIRSSCPYPSPYDE